MDRDQVEIKALRHFMMLAQAGNLSRASREHSVAKGTLSASLKRLEEQTGLLLMERSQNGLHLTEAGQALAERAPAVFDAHDVAISAAMRAHSKIEGSVRVVAAHEFGATILGEAAIAIARKAPSLQFDLEFYPAETLFRRLVDFDCMIFFGEPPATWLIARKLGEVRYAVYAAPALQSKFSHARDCEDLTGMPGVELRRNGLSEPWLVESSSITTSVRFETRFRVHDYWMARYIAQSGLAAAYLPSFFVRDDLRAGLLRPLLPDRGSPSHGVHLLYPQSRKANPRVRMVVEELDRTLRAMVLDGN
ncbi:LysR family transcriptional regulator [Shimia sp. SDUM112013]|uniref:LysR family transcriptional regulator n=1 Tax=Shimia sp. SDUM112013 TaxID=3136160 RepID=UPI0032EBEE14